MTPLMLTLFAGAAQAEPPTCDSTETVIAVVPLDPCQVDGEEGFSGEAHVLVTHFQFDPGANACVEAGQQLDVYSSSTCISVHAWPQLEWMLPVPNDEDDPANDAWKIFKDLWPLP